MVSCCRLCSLLLGNCHASGPIGYPESSVACSQSLTGSSQGSSLGDLYADPRAFLASLECIATVGEECCAVLFYEQSRCAAGKAAKVSHIGEMGEEGRIDSKLVKRKPEVIQSLFGPAPARVLVRRFRRQVRQPVPPGFALSLAREDPGR